uniref:Secreted protein n=1 Tax=Paramormyrops kingsleyae TaxID=1676925 RepID=A0A3B3QI39_9TELE
LGEMLLVALALLIKMSISCLANIHCMNSPCRLLFNMFGWALFGDCIAAARSLYGGRVQLTVLFEKRDVWQSGPTSGSVPCGEAQLAARHQLGFN